MNGAIAEPSVKIIAAPNRTRKKMIGANHHFFRILRNSQNSKSIESFESFDIACSQLLEFNGINPSALILLETASATSRYPSVV